MVRLCVFVVFCWLWCVVSFVRLCCVFDVVYYLLGVGVWLCVNIVFKFVVKCLVDWLCYD